MRGHFEIANYQAVIWKCSLVNLPDSPDITVGHGSEIDNDGKMKIRWMVCPQAPDAVLSVIFCIYARRCLPSVCSCMLNGLTCTIVGKLKKCCNTAEENDEKKQKLW